MKFGFEIGHTEDYYNQLSNQYGTYSYNTLTAYALDFSGNTTGAKNWNTYSQRFGTPTADTNMVTYGFYGQDTYRLSSRAIFNFGVRYDYTHVPQPTIVNPDYPATSVIPSAKNNIAPRVGLSYGLGASRKTLLRAGYGIFLRPHPEWPGEHVLSEQQRVPAVYFLQRRHTRAACRRPGLPLQSALHFVYAAGGDRGHHDRRQEPAQSLHAAGQRRNRA